MQAVFFKQPILRRAFFMSTTVACLAATTTTTTIIIIIIIITIIIISGTRKRPRRLFMVNPQTRNLDFRGFDSSSFLDLRSGIPRSVRSFPESQTQSFLVLYS